MGVMPPFLEAGCGRAVNSSFFHILAEASASRVGPLEVGFWESFLELSLKSVSLASHDSVSHPNLLIKPFLLQVSRMDSVITTKQISVSDNCSCRVDNTGSQFQLGPDQIE